jgi:hypothetical protein
MSSRCTKREAAGAVERMSLLRFIGHCARGELRYWLGIRLERANGCATRLATESLGRTAHWRNRRKGFDRRVTSVQGDSPAH